MYAVVSATSILVAVLNLLLPLLTGRAIDEIRLGEDANATFALWLAVGVFAADFATTLISNFGGYFGDQINVRLQKSLSENYFTHLTTLPQRFFDVQLSGKLIARLNRSITEISSFMQMMSNTFLQFIFSTIFSLAIIAFYSPLLALMLGSLLPRIHHPGQNRRSTTGSATPKSGMRPRQT